MKVGVLTALLADLSLDQVLEKLKRVGIDTVELGTGNYPGGPHRKLFMLESKTALKEFKQKLDDNGFTISALSCLGEPLHSNSDIAKAAQEVNRKTILLAEKLGVPVVIDFSGCPGDRDKANYPNWVVSPWPPHYQELLAWQWEKKIIPYWSKRTKFAEDHGVKVALEMHPGFSVYSPKTMLKPRAARGRNIGANYDPSHMFWRGIDPIAAIRVLDMQNYTDEADRGWIFRTVGYGHGADWCKQIIPTLRMFNYDYLLSIEHEDSLMAPEEGLKKAVRFRKEIAIEQKPGVAYRA